MWEVKFCEKVLQNKCNYDKIRNGSGQNTERYADVAEWQTHQTQNLT